MERETSAKLGRWGGYRVALISVGHFPPNPSFYSQGHPTIIPMHFIPFHTLLLCSRVLFSFVTWTMFLLCNLDNDAKRVENTYDSDDSFDTEQDPN